MQTPSQTVVWAHSMRENESKRQNLSEKLSCKGYFALKRAYNVRGSMPLFFIQGSNLMSHLLDSLPSISRFALNYTSL